MLRTNLLLLLILLSIGAYAQDTTRLRLLFVGDIMQHDSNIAAAWNNTLNRYDYSSCFQYVKPIFHEADITIGNLELTLAGKPFKGYPQFSAPDELAYELKNAGVDVLVTANNHSVDRGRKGIERTLDVLDTLKIIHTGTFRDSAERAQNYPLIIEQNGFKLSLLNYTYGTNGIPVPKPVKVNLIDTIQMKKDLTKARLQKTDAIIVFIHWGDEYQSLPNKTQKKLAELCFREGARLVIGAHPHVLQPMEWRKDKNQFVAYSLGNFVSGQRPRYRDGGAMVWIDLQKITSDSLNTSVSIADTKYELVWVEKATLAENSFTILPYRYFENDSLLITETALRSAFNVFKNDSRTLLAKHNKQVSELKILNQATKYLVELPPMGQPEIDSLFRNTNLKSYQSLLTAGTISAIGPFESYDASKEVLKEVQMIQEFKKARIKKIISADITSASGK